MKKVFVILCIVLFAINVSAQKTVIKVNLLSPLVRTGSFFLEHAIGEETSIQLGALFTGFKAGDTKFSGFAITPEFRYYLSESPAPKGMFIAPYLRYQSFNLEEEITASKATFSGFGGGLLVGKQWIFKERISLELFIGPSYLSGSVDVESGTEDEFEVDAFDGFGLRSGITLGVAF